MENPNRNRITVIAPLKPLCVPFGANQSFSKEILNRRTRRTAMLWERLRLVYPEERATAPERPKSDILVNNLTQQMIFRVFLTNRSHKPVEWDPAGFVLLKKIFRKVAKARESAARRWEVAHSRGMGHGAIDSRALHTALRLLLKQTEENEKFDILSEICEEKLKRTLTRALRGISEQPRTSILPDIRITQKRNALLKLLTVKYADFPTDRKESGTSLSDYLESVTKRYEEIEIHPILRKEGLFMRHMREISLLRGSFGSRLDSRTLEELNKIIKRAYSASSDNPQGGAVFRTVENSEHMVMLIPPAQTDAYRANDDYIRQLPPIEYKRNQPREQAELMIPKRPKVINRRQTQTDTPAITGRLENFSREEINRLADKIYAQIETRVLRERRRAGI